MRSEATCLFLSHLFNSCDKNKMDSSRRLPPDVFPALQFGSEQLNPRLRRTSGREPSRSRAPAGGAVGGRAPTLRLFTSGRGDNRLRVASWCDARRENAICMPHSHLPATKIDPLCPLYLLTHSHLTHTHTLSLGFLSVCVCVLKWTPSRHLKGIYAEPGLRVFPVTV